jgi:hypothetical protein
VQMDGKGMAVGKRESQEVVVQGKEKEDEK